MLNEKIIKFEKEKLYFESHGIKVGAWLCPSIGYGGPEKPSYCDNDAYLEYTRIKSSAENEVYAYCPLDKNFTADFINTVCSLAENFDEILKTTSVDELTDDGIHPTVRGHKIIAVEWIKDSL